MVTTIVLKHGWKTAHFYLKMDHRVAPPHVHAFSNTHLPSFGGPIAMKQQRPSSETTTWRSGDRPELSKTAALEMTVEERPLALEMCLHKHDDHLETWLKNGWFSPRNRPPRGATAWHTPYSPPICIPLMAQSLWKKNCPHWKHPRGRPTIALSFQDDRPENSPKTAILGHQIGRRTG